MKNLMVLNLPRKLDVEGLSKVFSEYGDVNSCEIVMDKEQGTSKGFGFVAMANADCAAKALEELHGTKIGNKRIRVKVSNKG